MKRFNRMTKMLASSSIIPTDFQVARFTERMWTAKTSARELVSLGYTTLPFPEARTLDALVSMLIEYEANQRVAEEAAENQR